MEKKYEIKYEPVQFETHKKECYNIYYYVDGEFETKEYHSSDGEDVIEKRKPEYQKLNQN